MINLTILRVEMDEERPVFSGEKHFIRIYDKTGSYKTLFQPCDTHAKYMYEELTEKFKLTYTQDYRIFIQKYGVGEYARTPLTVIFFVCSFLSRNYAW